jgi:hypothetical protein
MSNIASVRVEFTERTRHLAEKTSRVMGPQAQSAAWARTLSMMAVESMQSETLGKMEKSRATERDGLAIRLAKVLLSERFW